MLRLCRHAGVGEVAGSGDGQIALARRRRFWTVAAKQELIVRADEPAQAQAGQAEIALHVGEAGLDYLPLAGGDAVVLGLHEAPGKVARGFVDIARDLARGLLRATPGLQRAGIAVVFARPVEQGPAVMHLAGGFENVAARAEVKIAVWLEPEVRA